MAGHGIIINWSNYLPFVFTFNPTEIDTVKKINYFTAPNIGGAFHEKFFTGFENTELNFSLTCIDMESPDGVKKEIAYFEEFRKPAPGYLGLVSSIFGNENYPPPKMLFQFGYSDVPLLWDVLNVSIKADLFHGGSTRGVIGVPKRAMIGLTISLDESSIIYKAQQIADKAKVVAASVTSIKKELFHKSRGARKEQAGIFNANRFKNL